MYYRTILKTRERTLGRGLMVQHWDTTDKPWQPASPTKHLRESREHSSRFLYLTAATKTKQLQQRQLLYIMKLQESRAVTGRPETNY